MSSVSIQGNASGTGIFTIASPNSNTNRTLTLPDSSGTLALAGSSLTGVTESATPFETALGTGAGVVNTGVNNTFIGYESGNDNTSGQDNTVVGYQALDANSTGSYNAAIGSNSMGANTTGQRNTAVGYNALSTNSTGVQNVAVGMYALNATTSSYNVALGYAALENVGNAPRNTAVGWQAGNGITTGDNNVCIGYDTDTSASNSGDQIVIGVSITGQQNSSVTIGSGGGKIYNLYTVNATWTQTSDERLKKNIQDDTLGLSFVNRLRPVKYEWKASNELDQDNPYYAEENKRTTGVTMHGLLAQEVKAALDAEGITTFAGWDQGPDGIQAISREMFITPLIKAIQELNAKVEAQAAEIAALKGAA